LPLQQPLGHEVASQTHLPVLALHSWPDPQAAQATPALPQLALTSVVMQLPLGSQQPLGHEVASQTHLPWELHSWLAGHVAHVAPLDPHAALDVPPTHTELALQQPLHETPPQPHDPPVHPWPAAHVPHTSPLFPHWLALWLPSATQVVPLQQPFGHEVAVQTQLVPSVEQAVPVPHAVHALPPLPQVALAAAVTHLPFESQHPFGHEAASHWHRPVAALHSWPAAQATHCAPDLPHAPSVAVTQAPVGSQQPEGHVVASHEHEPFTQCWPRPHVLPHLPQFLSSLLVLMSQPFLSALAGQWAYGLVQAYWHWATAGPASGAPASPATTPHDGVPLAVPQT
jgi:hypothetical protein